MIRSARIGYITRPGGHIVNPRDLTLEVTPPTPLGPEESLRAEVTEARMIDGERLWGVVTITQKRVPASAVRRETEARVERIIANLPEGVQQKGAKSLARDVKEEVYREMLDRAIPQEKRVTFHYTPGTASIIVVHSASKGDWDTVIYALRAFADAREIKLVVTPWSKIADAKTPAVMTMRAIRDGQFETIEPGHDWVRAAGLDGQVVTATGNGASDMIEEALASGYTVVGMSVLIYRRLTARLSDDLTLRSIRLTDVVDMPESDGATEGSCDVDGDITPLLYSCELDHAALVIERTFNVTPKQEDVAEKQQTTTEGER